MAFSPFLSYINVSVHAAQEVCGRAARPRRSLRRKTACSGAQRQYPVGLLRLDDPERAFFATRAESATPQRFGDDRARFGGARGYRRTFTAWKKLATEGQVRGAARTVLGSQEFGDTLIRDHGRILFERTGMKDTTMAFSSLWRREKAGWRLYLDSVRAER